MALTKAHNRMIAGDVVNVVDYGAVGDGVTDDTTAFTNALAASSVVFIPAGTYKLASTLVLPDGCRLFGLHPITTQLNFTGTGAAIQAIGTLSPDNSYEQIWIEGFTLDGGKGSATSGNYGIEVAKTNDIRISRIVFQNNGDHDIYLKGGNFQGSLDDLRFAGSYGWAVYVDQAGSYTRNNAFDFTRSLMYGTTYAGGIYLDQCNTWKMRSVRLESTTTDMVYLQADDNVNLIELDTCYLENNALTSTMIDLNGSSSAVRNFKIRNSTISSASTSANTLIDMDNVADAMIEGNRLFNTDSSATSSFICIKTTANTGRVFDVGNDFTLGGSAVNRSINQTQLNARTYFIDYERAERKSLVTAKTSDDTLTIDDADTIFTNEGAGAVVTLSLPTATANNKGVKYQFIRNNGTHALRVDPNGTEVFRGQGAGKYLSIDSNGGGVIITTTTTGVWEIQSSNGTISYEP